MMNPRRSFLERAVVAAMVVAIHSYRIVIAPFWIGGCRHIPTCSRYAVEALQLHGIKEGTKLALKRIMRCRPRGTWGYDPVEHVK